MKPYMTEVEVKTKYSIEIHANDEADASAQAEDMDLDAIEAGGDFVELIGVEVVAIERMESEDEEDDGVVEDRDPSIYTEEEASEAYAKEAVEDTDNIAMSTGTDNNVEDIADDKI